MALVEVNQLKIGEGQALVLIAGPCALESAGLAMEVASELKRITHELHMPFIFKSSYDKANRTSIKSFRGPGLTKGLELLQKIKQDLALPLLTDVHQVAEVQPVSEIADILQIPAFLCRQTDLLVAVAKSGKVVNVKKGQFLSPFEMEHVVEKITASGNRKILLTERGTSFGYQDLVADMRSLAIMKKLGYPVIFDCTHAVQSPGGAGGKSGGKREYAPLLARAAVATGMCDGIFMEVHPDPDRALSDGATMLSLSEGPSLLKQLQKLGEVVR
jgi:2-dehydro-3-deoxyphosphooctonate aldolase (KDO 8-P synthase)